MAEGRGQMTEGYYRCVVVWTVKSVLTFMATAIHSAVLYASSERSV